MTNRTRSLVDARRSESWLPRTSPRPPFERRCVCKFVAVLLVAAGEQTDMAADWLHRAGHARRQTRWQSLPKSETCDAPRTLSPAHNKDSKTEETATRNPRKTRKDGPETESEEERSQYVSVSPEDALRNTTDLGAFQGIRI